MMEPDKRRRVLQDLDRFLQNVPKESDVVVALRQFGLAYKVTVEQSTEAAWVRELRRLISDSLVN
jgi:hypothetical protein